MSLHWETNFIDDLVQLSATLRPTFNLDTPKLILISLLCNMSNIRSVAFAHPTYI